MRALLSFMKVGLKMEYKDYLAHYGILGQKWGIRRFQPYSVRGRQSGEGGKEVGLAKKRSKQPTKEELLKSTNAAEIYKNRDQLSDRELRERVNRIQTEQQLKQLVGVKKTAGAGKIMSSKIMEKVGEKTAETVAKSIVAAGVSAATKVLIPVATVAVASFIASNNPNSKLWLV